MRGGKLRSDKQRDRLLGAPEVPPGGASSQHQRTGGSFRVTYHAHATMDIEASHSAPPTYRNHQLYTTVSTSAAAAAAPPSLQPSELRDAVALAANLFPMKQKMRLMESFPVDRAAAEVDTDSYVEVLRGVRGDRDATARSQAVVPLPPLAGAPRGGGAVANQGVLNGVTTEEHITLESRDGARMTYSRSRKHRSAARHPDVEIDRLLAERTAALTAIFQTKLRQQHQHFVRVLEAATTGRTAHGSVHEDHEGVAPVSEEKVEVVGETPAILSAASLVEELRSQLAEAQKQLQVANEKLLQARRKSATNTAAAATVVSERRVEVICRSTSTTPPGLRLWTAGTQTTGSVDGEGEASSVPPMPANFVDAASQTNVVTLAHVLAVEDDEMEQPAFPSGAVIEAPQLITSAVSVLSVGSSTDDATSSVAGNGQRAATQDNAQQTSGPPSPSVVNIMAATPPPVAQPPHAGRSARKLRSTLKPSGNGEGPPAVGVTIVADTTDVISVASGGDSRSAIGSRSSSTRKQREPTVEPPAAVAARPTSSVNLSGSPRSPGNASLSAPASALAPAAQSRPHAPPTGIVGFLAISGIEAAPRITGAQALSNFLSSALSTATGSAGSSYAGSESSGSPGFLASPLAPRPAGFGSVPVSAPHSLADRASFVCLFFDGDVCLLAFPAAPTVALQLAMDNLGSSLAFAFDVFKTESSFNFAGFPTYESRYSRAMRNLATFAARGEIVVPSLTYKRYVIPLADELTVRQLEATLHSSLLEDDLYSVHRERAVPTVVAPRKQVSSVGKAALSATKTTSSVSSSTGRAAGSSSRRSAAPASAAGQLAPVSQLPDDEGFKLDAELLRLLDGRRLTGLNSRFEFFASPQSALVSYCWVDPAAPGGDGVGHVDRRARRVAGRAKSAASEAAAPIAKHQRILIVNANEHLGEQLPADEVRLSGAQLQDRLEARRTLVQQGVQAEPTTDEVGCGPAEDVKMTSHLTQTPVVRTRNRAMGTSDAPAKIDEEDLEEVMEALSERGAQRGKTEAPSATDLPSASTAASGDDGMGGSLVYTDRTLRVRNKAADLSRCSACGIIPVKKPSRPRGLLSAAGIDNTDGLRPCVYIMTPCTHLYCSECVETRIKSVSRDADGIPQTSYSCAVCHQVSLDDPVACPALEVLMLERFGAQHESAITVEDDV